MEEEKKKTEERAKIEYTQEERLVILNAALEIPKLLKTGDIADLKLYFCLHKQKFRGPDPPLQVSVTSTSALGIDSSTVSPNTTVIEGGDPNNTSQLDPQTLEQLREEERLIAEFVDTLRTSVEQASRDLQEYRVLRKTVKPPRPLWPYPDDDPEARKRKEEEEKARRE